MKNSDHDPKLEDDVIWETLSKSPTQKASSAFTQNTVRAARLSQDATTSNWHRIFSSPTVAIGAITAVVTISAIFLLGGDNQHSLQLAGTSDTTTSQADWLNEALINTAIEEPDLFTDTEVIAMVF